MDFKIGDKVLFKNENLKGEVVKMNSNYKLTVLSSDGFELNIAVKDLVKIEQGTDKATSYGENFYTKDVVVKSSKIQKKKVDFIDRKQSNSDGIPGLVWIYCCSL